MIQALKTRLIECDHPVGVKKTSNWKLPPPDFAYGLRGKPDEEGVSIITRSWKVHNPSLTAQPPQDFITINKMAIKMNATTYATNKDFRKNIDIRKKVKYGSKERHIVLPPEDFAYGVPNRPPTPIKDVINNAYGNRAESVIRKEYATFMKEKQKMFHLTPRTTNHFNKLYELSRTRMNYDNQPEPELYKMRMFKDVGSKVAEGIKQFKTYHPYKKNNLDSMIEKVQGELNDAGANYQAPPQKVHISN